MATTKLKERAAAIQKADKSVFVFAATDRSVPKKSAVLTASYADHKCGDCGTVVTASADTPQPFCVTCGSHHVKATGSVKASIEASALASMRCTSCDTANVVSKKVLAAAQGHIHCINCGTKVTAAELPAAPEPAKLDAPNVSQKPLNVPDIEGFKIDMPVDEEFKPDLPVKSAAEENLTKDTPKADDAKPAVFKKATAPADDLVSPEATDEPEVKNDKDVKVEADIDDFDFAQEPTDVLDDVETSAWNFDKSETAADDLKVIEGLPDVETASEEDEENGEEEADADCLMDNLDIDDTKASLAFVSIGNKLVAMKGTVAVATLTAKNAGKSADIMHSDVMANSLSHAVEQAGLRKALASAGFKPIRIKAISSTLTDKKVQARVSEMAKTQAEKDATQVECMALAAAGLARNHWKNVPNPLMAAFDRELTRLGVRNPRAVSASLFHEHGVEFAKSIVTMAQTLQGYSKQTRKEQADLLDLTNPADDNVADLPVEGNNVDDMPMNDYDEAVESRLSRPAVATASLLKTRQSTSASTLDLANSILNGKARLSFGS